MPAGDRLRVRSRQPEDIPRLVEILVRVHETRGYPANLPSDPAAWLTGERLRACFVATVGGDVVGHVSSAVVTGDRAGGVWLAALGCSPEELTVVKRLFVDPALEGRGIGRRLLHRVVTDAHRAKTWPVLDVDERSARANALYTKAGFREVGVIEIPIGSGEAFRATCYVGPPPHGRAGESISS